MLHRRRIRGEGCQAAVLEGGMADSVHKPSEGLIRKAPVAERRDAYCIGSSSLRGEGG